MTRLNAVARKWVKFTLIVMYQAPYIYMYMQVVLLVQIV